MRNRLLLLLLCLAYFSCSQEQESREFAVMSNHANGTSKQVYILNGQSEPVMEVVFFESGDTMKVTEMKDSLYHGQSWQRDATGQIVASATFSAGKLDGVVRSFSNDIVTAEKEYDNDVPKRVTHFYNNGAKSYEIMIEDGNEKSFKSWYDNGVVEESYFFDGLAKGWYKSSQKKWEGSMSGGLEHGTWIWWDENGNQIREILYAAGDTIEDRILDSAAVQALDEQE